MGIKAFLNNVYSIIKKPEMLLLPGQLAFFFILSVVPILTLISYAASFLNLPINIISNFLTSAFGSDLATLVIPIVSEPNVNFSFFVTILVGFYIASNGASSIIITSNHIYGIKNSNFLKRKVKGLIMTFMLVLLFIFILIFLVFGKNILAFLGLMNIDTSSIHFIYNLIKGPITWLIIFFFIKVIYTLAPDRKIPSRYVNYGALFTTIMWVFTTAIYSYYTGHFAHYALYYGGLANIIVLMLWVYFLAYIFVIGLALNYKEEIVKLEKTGAIKLNFM